MKLRTSCFKGVALKKDILRFAPIWALYLIAMMLLMLEMGYYQDYDRYARNFMPGFITAFGVVNLCYAGLCANLLFGDLYNTKLCYSLHAMPYRRESWLITHLVSGLLFSLVPNCVACLYMMFRLEGYWFLALYWLLASTLQFIFFYGVATVSAMLTGNRFAMLAVYAGFNFVAMLLYATVEVIYLPMMEGVLANVEGFTRFSPVVQLFQYKYFTFTRTEINNIGTYHESNIFYRFDGFADGWGYLAILAVVGLAAMVLSFWLYRKRHLESAGDFIAFPKLKGIACVIMTLCVTLCFALVGELFDGFILWLIVGLFVGFFGSLMLLERRLKVFRKKTFLGFGAMALAVTLSLLAMYCDWFGIESWTPKASHVVSVTVSDSRIDHPSYGGLRATVEDEYDIQQVIAAHEDALNYLDDDHNGSRNFYVYLTYKMKSGRTVSRYYRIPSTSEGYEIVRHYLYNTESVLGFKDPAVAAANVTYMYCGKGYQIPASMYEKVFRALQTDHANGLVDTGYDAEYFIEYNLTDNEGNVIHRGVAFQKEGSQTYKLLSGPEIVMDYSDWSAFVSSIEKLTFYGGEHGGEISKADWEGLLNAIRKDIEAGTILDDVYTSIDFIVCYEMRHPNGGYDYREIQFTRAAENTMTWLTEQGYIPKD